MAQDDSRAEDRTPMADGRDDAVWKLQHMNGHMTLGAAALSIEHDLACIDRNSDDGLRAPHAIFTSYLKPS